MGVRTEAGSSVAALAAEYLDAVTRGEGIAAAERYFHPEIVYIVNGPPSPTKEVDLPGLSGELHSALPWLGMYRGLEEVRAFLTHMHSNLDVTEYGPREVVGDDQRAAVFGWFGLRSRPAGRKARIAFSVLVESRDGKIARYQFLENTFDVALAFRSGGSWALHTDGTTTTVPTERQITNDDQ
jgi:ketosteroid isomerase-like protein